MPKTVLMATLLLAGAIGCDVSTPTANTEVKPPVEGPANEDTSRATTAVSPESETQSEEPTVVEAKTELAEATFGAGCFWCVEAVFLQLKGVESVESGYMGGTVVNPTYEQVCNEDTGHAEVCHIKYDPKTISFDELLQVFWKTHDPTTPDRQGNDRGPQYRSVVFYHSDEQKALAEEYKKELDAVGAWPDPIVTEISPAAVFYKAEAYHQNFFNLNPGNPYCQVIIPPKLEKLRKVFGDKLKTPE